MLSVGFWRRQAYSARVGTTVREKGMCVWLIAVAALLLGGCGSSNNASTSTSRVQRISLRSAPSYKAAASACGAVPRATLARSLGISTTDPTSIATRYAERHAPLAARRDVYEGCYAALTR